MYIRVCNIYIEIKTHRVEVLHLRHQLPHEPLDFLNRDLDPVRLGAQLVAHVEGAGVLQTLLKSRGTSIYMYTHTHTHTHTHIYVCVCVYIYIYYNYIYIHIYIHIYLYYYYY